MIHRMKIANLSQVSSLGAGHSDPLEAGAFLFFALLSTFLGIACLAVESPLLLLVAFSTLLAFSFKSPKLCLSLILAAAIFQNTILASLSGHIPSDDLFKASQGVNFLTFSAFGSIFAVVCLTTTDPRIMRHKRKVMLSALLLAVLVVYVAIGAKNANLASAIVYFRQSSILCFAFICGLYLGARINEKFLWDILLVTAIIVLALGFFELFFPDEFYTLLQVGKFNSFKFQNNPELHHPELIAKSTEFSWLNLTGDYALDIKARKLTGPTLHNISFGYVIAFLALTCLYRSRYFLCLASIGLLIYVGAKGPLAICLAALLVFSLLQLTRTKARSAEKIVVAIAVAYTALVIAYGIKSIDLHVLGLLSGLNSIFHSPMGHGLGMGGNLSDAARASRDIVEYRASGVPFAIESATGVLLYQIGIFTSLLILVFLSAAKGLRSVAAKDRKATVFVASLYFLFCNTLFQEESLAPAAAGLFFLLYGFLISNSDRVETSLDKFP